MAQASRSPPRFYGQQFHDGALVESPMSPDHEKLQDGTNGAMIESSNMPVRARASGESRQELLRLPAHPHPAHIDQTIESEPSTVPMHQSSGVGLTPQKATSIRKYGGQPDPNNDWISSNRLRHQKQPSTDFHTSQPFSPANRRPAYVEDYSEEEDDPRMYRRRPTRRSQRPPASYSNYADQNARYGPLPRASVDVNMHPAYADTPGKPNYEMYYPHEDHYARPRRIASAGGSRLPPRGPPPESVMRLPWAVWMGSNAKNHFVAFVGEFVGTTMFLFFAFSGTQVANVGSSAAPTSNTTTGEAAGFDPNVLLYISVVFAFSLMVNVWVFFRISGGLFNPAVTFAMLLCRALSPIRAFLLLAAQMSGSIFASFLVSVLFPTNFNVRTTLGEGTSLAQGVFIETILTAELVFTIFMLAKEKHKATFIAPVGIGLALFIAELVGVYYTGGSLNPARSFGPCVITGVFDQEHWIYWVGPALGAIIAVVFYKFIKILEYEVANPGQDDDDKDQEVKEEMQRERDASPDVEMGLGASNPVPTATPAARMPAPAPSLDASSLKAAMEKKAQKWEGQGFGGRGEDTY